MTTVQDSIKVLATKGQKQVGQISSAERGTLITMCGTINALGNSIPPLIIFPRVHYKDFMIKGAPHGTVGAANPSGWISADIFLYYLQHFVKHSSPTKDKPVLLVMDNHDSHISLKAIDYAKTNHVILFTFPPHTTHRLQPLDRCVYGPLKKYYNGACREWLLQHPGKRITIYDVPEILGRVYPLAFSNKNIISAFQKTGLYPFNRHVFDDSEFLAASVTDMIQDETTVATSSSTSTSLERPTTPQQFIPPHVIHPYPKAGRIDNPKKGRKKRSSQVLTDTPVREEIAEAELLRVSKKKKKNVKRNLNKPTTLKKTDFSDTSSDSLSASGIPDSKSSDDDISEKTKEKDLKISGYVLVRFATKKQIKFYVGQVKEILEDEIVVLFLRRKNDKFVFPTVEDKASVDKSDITVILSDPLITGATARTNSAFKFNFDFSTYNVC